MRPTLLNPLFASALKLDGIGPKLLTLVTKLTRGSEHGPEARILDILTHLPSGIIDRRNQPGIANALQGTIVTLKLHIDSHQLPPRGNKRVPYKVFAHDNTGEITLTFFNANHAYIARQLPQGEIRYVSGKMEWFNERASIVHPDFIASEAEFSDIALVEPVYPMTAGLSSKTYYKATRSALKSLPQLPEWLDTNLLNREHWPSHNQALQMAHSPRDGLDIDPQSLARRRLAYDELLASQLALGLMRNKMAKAHGRKFNASGKLKAKILKNLPYTLTSSQVQATQEIETDLSREERMLRLLQGDVGAGKTIVALLAMAHVIEAGAQSVMMAPTEILARQHLASIEPIANLVGLQCAVLTGREKGKTREDLLTKLAAGEIDILLGTHALFQSGVTFKNLGLAVIDEQHRFGVHQRLSLASKGITPDLLLMTATPIPRTLVLTYFGDMDVSKLTEKPPGRQEIQTRTMSLERLPELIDRLKIAVERADKVYWICPLVEDNEELQLTSAEDRFKSLIDHFGSEKIGLVHGRMKPAEKDKAMLAFKNGDIRILVATTVVEVGVDVPDATIMIIEHAERFGLSQLHQLRGRVGRSDQASNCLLLYKGPLGEVAKSRLSIMRETQDGFRLAEEDLRLRGEGEVLGTRQSGMPGFQIADTQHHADLLAMARDDARMWIAKDPELKTERGEALRLLLYLFGRDEAIRLINAG